MNKTILVLIGIACALISAAGIMHKHPIHPKRIGISYRGPYFEEIAKSGKSIPEIRELLKDENPGIREAAEQILKALGVPEAEIEDAKKDK